MKSAQINKYGSSDVIEINQNTPEPSLSPKKVLVAIKAAGVNPVDWKISEGNFQQMFPLQFPSTLGIDFAGVIKQVGEGVSPSDFKQGDEVFGQAGVISGGSGAFAEVAQWVDQNNIRVNVEKEFSLDQTGDALDYQKNVHPRGKVVLTI